MPSALPLPVVNQAGSLLFKGRVSLTCSFIV